VRVEELFRRMPRCVGLYGDVVDKWEELLRYVSLHSGVEDVYVCLYDTSLTIDKIFFDIDSSSLDNAFDAVKRLLRRLEELDLPYIPVFSGKKGFHIYIPVKPWKPSNIETAKAVLRDVQESLAGDIREADKHVFGDVRRKVRFPNTLNNSNYATPLPSHFTSWSLSQVIDWSKKPRDVDYDAKPIDLEVLTDVDVHYYDHNSHQLASTYTAPVSAVSVLRLLRPCVAEALLSDKEPPHMLRVEMVSELMWLGFTEEQVVGFIKTLGWSDFDEKVTRYQVHNIFSRMYKPLTCSKLRDFVRCRGCGWFYWWGVYDKPW
jgi:hypothetical protein